MNEEILIFGDVMLDCYVKGESNRLSPEAPVPVVNVNEEFYRLGGAANVAQNISNLETPCGVCGIIGKDYGGKVIVNLFKDSNIGDYSIPNAEAITTTKTRVVSGNQQIVRFDKETILPSSNNFSNEKIKALMTKTSRKIVIVSDYAKGVCSDKMLEALLSYSPESKILIDPKGNNWEKYKGAYLVKPNLKELSVIAGQEIKNENEEVVKYGKTVLEKYNFQHLLVTRGNKGMTLISKDKVSHHTVEKIQVYDVSGAGDTVISVLAVMLNNGYELEYSVDTANEAGRYVVSQPYTYAINKSELENIISKNINVKKKKLPKSKLA